MDEKRGLDGADRSDRTCRIGVRSNILCRSIVDEHRLYHMNIAFIISSLGTGGAERVAQVLCNQWANRGHGVHLVTFEAPGTPSIYPLESAITRHQLDLLRESAGIIDSLARNVHRIRSIRRTLGEIEPDVAVAFATETNILAILASVGRPWPVVISERIHPGHHRIGRPYSILRTFTYPFAEDVVVQTKEIASWMKEHVGIHARIVPNPVDPRRFARRGTARSHDCADVKRLVAVGRLDPQKGFDVLLDAFARIADKHSSWTLTIFGEGPERAALQDQAARLGIAERVSFPGRVDDIPAKLAETDLFVHSARYEGYPNVVIEALAAECCVVATDCPGGTRELLRDGRYGILVPPDDRDHLAQALGRLMADEAERVRLAGEAPKAVAGLSHEHIADQWLQLFEAHRAAR